MLNKLERLNKINNIGLYIIYYVNQSVKLKE